MVFVAGHERRGHVFHVELSKLTIPSFDHVAQIGVVLGEVRLNQFELLFALPEAPHFDCQVF